MSLNIFNLEQEYLYLIQAIEETDGEITEEIAERLVINEDDFKEKFDAYAHIINLKKGQNKIVDDEIERLSAIKTSNEKTIERLKTTLNDALNLFGEVGKSGNRNLKTQLHSCYNIFHKPLVINKDATIPARFVEYALKDKLTDIGRLNIIKALTAIDKDAIITFESSIDRKELKKAIEAGEEIDGVSIDKNASYIVIK